MFAFHYSDGLFFLIQSRHAYLLNNKGDPPAENKVFLSTLTGRLYFFLCRFDTHGADFQFCGVRGWIISGAGQHVDRSFSKTETRKDRALRRTRRGLDLDLDLASSTRYLRPAAVGQSPFLYILWIDLQIFFRRKIFDAGRAPGLSARMIIIQSPAGCQPDWINIIDYFSGVAISDHFEDRFAADETAFMQTWRAGMSLVRNRPLILPAVHHVPIHAGVDRRDTA